MIRIGIVDDHAIIRTALQATLETHVDFRVVATAATGEDAIGISTAGNLDLLLMDLGLRGTSGIEAITEIRRLAPDLRILVYSAFPEELYGTTLLNMGVRGYVGKEQDIQTLVGAIRTVAQGGIHASREVREQAQSAQGRGGPEAHKLLSFREMQVFLKLAKGARIGDVAKEMDVSIKTASTYRSRILAKLNMTSNTEFTRYAVAHHLIT